MWLTALSFLKSKLGVIDYVLIACLIVALGWSASLKLEVWNLKGDLSTCKDEKEKIADENGYLLTDKARYENAIAIRQEDQKEKIVYVDKEVKVVQWRTETKIKTIKEYVKDENLTDCQNALNFARTAF